MATSLFLSNIAWAGYGVQPSAGAITGPSPSFLVYLDSLDSSATVYVSTTADTGTYGFPPGEIGSCAPTTPFGEANKYTCAPSFYLSTSTSQLAPGTYYWSLIFYRTDPGQSFPTLHVSGPFQFTVAQPTQPTGIYLTSPADGATVATLTPKVGFHAPAGTTVDTYVADSSERNSDGSPLGLTEVHCDGPLSSTDDYTCQVPSTSTMYDGGTYYWWIVVTDTSGYRWVFGPRSFTVQLASTGGGGGGSSGGGGGSGGGSQPHDLSFAPYLPSSTHFSGTKSVKQIRLSKAAYALSKLLRRPKSIAVACWDQSDWSNISGDNPESVYTTLGFWTPDMPHWLQLSPGICHTMEVLLYHRPLYPNRYIANAVDTLTHEMIHALGVQNEAQTECFAMQLNWVTANQLGVPSHYSTRLSHLSLGNYGLHPPSYRNYSACREGGAWDLWPNQPSLPWHDFQV